MKEKERSISHNRTKGETNRMKKPTSFTESFVGAGKALAYVLFLRMFCNLIDFGKAPWAVRKKANRAQKLLRNSKADSDPARFSA